MDPKLGYHITGFEAEIAENEITVFSAGAVIGAGLTAETDNRGKAK
jgi:hypothetical protein